MKRIILIPDRDKAQNRRYKKQGRLSWTYLHGDLEMDCKYDCYNIANPEDFGFKFEYPDCAILAMDENKAGIIPCQYKRKPCTLFLWFDSMKDRHWHGLVVYDADLESYKYAEECFNKKESCI